MAGPQQRVLGFARLTLARLGLNDGAKLWVAVVALLYPSIFNKLSGPTSKVPRSVS